MKYNENKHSQYIEKAKFELLNSEQKEIVISILTSPMKKEMKHLSLKGIIKSFDLVSEQQKSIVELKEANRKQKEQAHKQSSSGGKAQARNFNGCSIHKYQRQFLCILYIHIRKFRLLIDSTMTIRFSREDIEKAIKFGIACNFLDEQEDLGSMYSYQGDWGITDNRIGSFYQGIGSMGYESKFSKDKKKSIEGSQYVYSYTFQLLTHKRALNITAKKTKSNADIQIARREFLLSNIEDAFQLEEGRMNPEKLQIFLDGIFDR